MSLVSACRTRPKPLPYETKAHTRGAAALRHSAATPTAARRGSRCNFRPRTAVPMRGVRLLTMNSLWRRCRVFRARGVLSPRRSRDLTQKNLLGRWLEPFLFPANQGGKGKGASEGVPAGSESAACAAKERCGTIGRSQWQQSHLVTSTASGAPSSPSSSSRLRSSRRCADQLSRCLVACAPHAPVR